MCKPALAFLVILSAAAQAFPACADITSLTLNPPKVDTCAIETITVNATGKCSTMEVAFGDNSGGLLVLHGKGNPITFPAKFSHRYTAPGSFTVGVDACGSKKSATVQVAGPRITSMGIEFASDATPGALVVL